MIYYILQGEETKGPYTIGQLRSLWNSGAITGRTLYWREGFSKWLPLIDMVSELEQTPGPPPANPPMLPQKPKTPLAFILGRFIGGRPILACIAAIVGLFVIFGLAAVISHSGSRPQAKESELPYAPLRCGFRQSALDSNGRVLQVQNISEKGLSCTLGYPGGKLRFFLKPYDSTEFGALEIGKSFRSGDTFSIDVEGYHASEVLPVP